MGKNTNHFSKHNFDLVLQLLEEKTSCMYLPFKIIFPFKQQKKRKLKKKETSMCYDGDKALIPLKGPEQSSRCIEKPKKWPRRESLLSVKVNVSFFSSTRPDISFTQTGGRCLLSEILSSRCLECEVKFMKNSEREKKSAYET